MDQTKYVNTYISNAIETINELMTATLQLRTQLKMAIETVNEKDNEINALREELNKFSPEEYQKAITNSKIWEDSYHAAMNKASHLDTALAQITELNKKLKEKDIEISKLKSSPKSSKKKLLLTELVPADKAQEVVNNDKQVENDF